MGGVGCEVNKCKGCYALENVESWETPIYDCCLFPDTDKVCRFTKSTIKKLVDARMEIENWSYQFIEDLLPCGKIISREPREEEIKALNKLIAWFDKKMAGAP